MKTWIYDDSAEEDDDDAFIYSSDVAIAVNNTADAGELAASKNWKLTEPEPSQRPWTDDYSNILRALIKKLEWPGWNVFVQMMRLPSPSCPVHVSFSLSPRAGRGSG